MKKKTFLWRPNERQINRATLPGPTHDVWGERCRKGAHFFMDLCLGLWCAPPIARCLRVLRFCIAQLQYNFPLSALFTVMYGRAMGGSLSGIHKWASGTSNARNTFSGKDSSRVLTWIRGGFWHVCFQNFHFCGARRGPIIICEKLHRISSVERSELDLRVRSVRNHHIQVREDSNRIEN